MEDIKIVELNAIIHSQRETLRELNETRDILRKEKRILESRLDRAKRALCEVSRLSLQDNVDISRFYDIAHYAITELNKELK